MSIFFAALSMEVGSKKLTKCLLLGNRYIYRWKMYTIEFPSGIGSVLAVHTTA